MLARRRGRRRAVTVQRLKRLRQPEEQSPSRPELRGTDTDAGAIADLVLPVEQIDDVEARGERAAPVQSEHVSRAEIDLHVVRQMLAVRYTGTAIDRGLARRQFEICAQTRAQQEIRTEPGVIPEIRHAAGGGLLLLMVEMNEIVGDVGQVGGLEIELCGVDILALGALGRKIQIGVEAAGGVVARKLDAELPAVEIVEWRQDDRRSELAFIDQVV